MPSGKSCCDKDTGDKSIPDECCGALRNFDTIDMRLTMADTSGTYDLKSVMQYRSDAFASPGRQTLVPARSGIVVPSRSIGFPSLGDFERVCKLYGSVCPFTGEGSGFQSATLSRRVNIHLRTWVMSGS